MSDTINLNNKFISVFKDENIRNYIYTYPNPIQCIKLDGNNLLIEKNNNSEISQVKIIIESLQQEVPDFILKKLNEAQKVLLSAGVTSLNNFLIDDYSNILNQNSINCVKIIANGNELNFYDDKGNLIDWESLKQSLEANKKTITKKDIVNLSNSLINNLLSDANFIKKLKSYDKVDNGIYKGITFKIQPGSLLESLNKSSIKAFKLEEGIFNKKKTNSINNDTNAEQINFSLKVKIIQNPDSMNDMNNILNTFIQKVSEDIAKEINQKYSNSSFKTTNNIDSSIQLKASASGDSIIINSIITPKKVNTQSTNNKQSSSNVKTSSNSTTQSSSIKTSNGNSNIAGNIGNVVGYGLGKVASAPIRATGGLIKGLYNGLTGRRLSNAVRNTAHNMRNSQIDTVHYN